VFWSVSAHQPAIPPTSPRKTRGSRGRDDGRNQRVSRTGKDTPSHMMAMLPASVVQPTRLVGNERLGTGRTTMETVRFEDLAEACELQGRQVAFIVTAWAKKDENYPTLARAVTRDIRETLQKARTLESGADRTELIRELEQMRSVVLFLDAQHYIRDTWSGSTSRHTQSVRSVRSAGLPGLGK
jgi:hypothetical protein